MGIDEPDKGVLSRLTVRRSDRIVELCEGPFSWDWLLQERNPDDMIYRLDPNLDAVIATS